MKLTSNVVGAVMTALGLKTNDAKAKKVSAAVEKALKANKTPKKALKANKTPKKAKKNARSNDDDHGQMVADLISDDASPFTTASEEALRMMSTDELKAVRDNYLRSSEGEEEPVVAEDEEPVVAEDEIIAEEGEEIITEEDEEPVVASDEEVDANEEEEKPVTAKKHSKKGRVLSINSADLSRLVANEVKKHAKAGLSVNDRAALNRAHLLVQADRSALVAKIVANSTMTKKSLQAMTTDHLTIIANGLPTIRPDYSGVIVNTGDEDDKIAADMAGGVNGTTGFYADRRNARRNAGAKKGAH